MKFVKAKTLNVIAYGMGNSFLESESYLLDRVNIVGCSDSDYGKRNSDISNRYKFYMPNEIAQSEFDYIFIVSIHDREICDQLVNQYGIDRNKIMLREEWSKVAFSKKEIDCYPDKYVYVISKPIRVKSGLFSYVFGAIEQLQYVDEDLCLPIVDMQHYPNIYLEEENIGKENVWDFYFEPVSTIKIEEMEAYENVVLGYDSPDYKSNYIEKYDIDKMHDTYKKYVHIKQEIMNEIDKVCNDILPYGFEHVMGVLFRGTDMTALKLKDHPVQPSVDEMCSLIDKHMAEWGCNTIYMCTEDEDALEFFKEKYGDRLVCTNQKRFKNTGNKWLGEIYEEMKIDRYELGLEYLITIEILSRCNNMIASVCAGSVCAHIMHGNQYEHLLMIDKGKYK